MLIVAASTFSLAHDDLANAAITPALALFAGVGALLADRRPRNPIGWLLLAAALLIAFNVMLDSLYSEQGPPPSTWQRGRSAGSGTGSLWCGSRRSACSSRCLFPDGRLPSPRWRGFLQLSLAALAIGLLGDMFGARTLDWGGHQTVPNPFRAPGAVGDIFGFLHGVAGVLFIFASLGALTGMALRFRRSTGLERLQFKWFFLAMGMLIVGLVVSAAGELVHAGPLGDAGWWLFLTSLIVALPVAIGFAIMRYRLYDIDLVISRDAGLWRAHGDARRRLPRAGAADRLAVGRSGFATAVSTLAVAALFRPAAGADPGRGRPPLLPPPLRRGADARGVRGAPARRARPRGAGRRHARVVRDTVQPAHVSLWLRGGR